MRSLLGAAAIGALAALAAAVLAMVLLSAVLVDTARYAIAFVGGALGAPLQLSLSGLLGGGEGALLDEASVKAHMHFPLTAAALIPAGALLWGGWVAAGRAARGAAPRAHAAAQAGALAGVLFGPLLLFANVFAGGDLQSRPLPTLVWGVLWGVPLGLLGALCRDTGSHPRAALARLVAPVERLPELSGLSDLAASALRVARTTVGVLGVYVAVSLLVGGFDESVVAGLAVCVLVVVATFGVPIARRLGARPQTSFGLLSPPPSWRASSCSPTSACASRSSAPSCCSRAPPSRRSTGRRVRRSTSRSTPERRSWGAAGTPTTGASRRGAPRRTPGA